MPAPPIPPVLQTLRLSNGIRVDLVVSTDPTIAQAAVCASRESGGGVAVDIGVLQAAGLSAEIVNRSLSRPVCLLTEGRFPVLVIESDHSEDAGVRENLRAGLDLLADLPPLATLWIPLLGNVHGVGLNFEQSAAFIVDALSRSPNRNGTRKVLLAAPSQEAARAIEQYRALELTPVKPERDRLEPHVEAALAAAYKFSGGLVDAGSVLRAVLVLASRPLSHRTRAFQSFAELLPRRAEMEESLLATHGPPFELQRPDTFRAFRPLASSLAQATRMFPDRMWGRHFVTAALLSGEPAGLEAFAREAGTTLPVLRRRWYQFLAGQDSHPREVWDRWWREAGLAPPLGLHAGYQPDAARGEDQLGLEAHLEAFARLITDNKVELPLSIGLLGDWGSGKSFFLDLLEKRIEGLEGSAGHCGNVVQIRFNAWTFSDANLWAGLVEQILQRVWNELVPEKSSKELREELRKAIEVANGAVHEANAQVSLAQVALEQAEANVKQRLESMAVTAMLGAEANKLWTQAVALARSLGWQKELATIVDVEEARQALGNSAERLRRTVQGALKDGLGWRWLPIGLAVLIVFSSSKLLAIVPSAWLAETLAPIGRTVGWIAGLLGPLLAPLLRASKRIDAFSDKLEETQKNYQTALAEAKKSPNLQTRALAEAAEKSRTELASAQASLESAQKRLADLLNEQAAQDPVRRLTSYLQERVGDYRTRQGIISLVRKDFEKLAQLMSDWRENSAKAPRGVTPVDRIVLYVDDLDRCSPALVVQALEAVHLLLALDLFVVVVAVDSRWLLRSLEVHYDELLGKRAADGLDASPQHYLEKIFQITFALAPMTEDGYERYIEHLTPDVGVRPAPQPAPPPPQLTGQANLQPGPGPRPADPAPLPPAPEPPRLTIHPHERDLMKRLHPLVPTPRTAKRLVNVFRLYKAALPPRAADDFEVANSGGYRPTLILLALLHGRPELARALYAPLCTGEAPFERPYSGLAEALKGWRAPPELAAQAAELHDLVNEVAPDLKVRECVPVARELARYSLMTGPWWHAWTRPHRRPPGSPTDGRGVVHAPAPPA